MESNISPLFNEEATSPYDKNLLERLRNEYYYGIPLSIYVLSDSLCVHQCHYLSIHLTRGMDHFRIVRANINELEKEPLGSHSWIEKDDWVYEEEEKSINHEVLLAEIERFRKKENLKQMYYPKYVKQKAKMFLASKNL